MSNAQLESMVVGVTLGSKQKQWLPALQNVARDWGKEEGIKVSVKGVDLSQSIEEQKLDIILHKLCTHIALEKSDAVKAEELHRLEEYFVKHPESSFDPLQSIRDINDRSVVVEKLAGIRVSNASGTVVQPDFFACSSREDAEALVDKVDFKLPWVCKPFVADGVPESHNLGMIVRKEGLLEAPLPYIIQPFINHDGQIIKVYVLGDQVVQLRRPSLPNVDNEDGKPSQEGPGFVPFGRVSNAGAAGGGEDCKVLPEDEKSVPPVADDLLKLLVAEMKRRLDLRLFGVDLIRSSQTGEYLIIDINYLPGYYGVSDVFGSLLQLMREELEKRRGLRK